MLEKLRARLDSNPRDRRIVMLGGAGLAVALFIVFPLVSFGIVMSDSSEVGDLRAALADVQAARAKLGIRKANEDRINARYNVPAPPLAGFIEERARAQKLEVTDSQDKQPVPAGKKFTERHTVIHLKKAGMYSISKFLESIEQAPHPVAVTRLNIRKRAAEPDSFDLEVGLSAYDKNPEKKAEKGSEKTGGGESGDGSGESKDDSDDKGAE